MHETTRALAEEYAGSAEPSCREGEGDGDQQPAIANWQNTGLVDVKTEVRSRELFIKISRLLLERQNPGSISLANGHACLCRGLTHSLRKNKPLFKPSGRWVQHIACQTKYKAPLCAALPMLVFNSQDLDKFNDFFMEKEEEFIIRSQALEDKLEGQTDKTQLRRIRKQFTDLHGEPL